MAVQLNIEVMGNISCFDWTFGKLPEKRRPKIYPAPTICYLIAARVATGHVVIMKDITTTTLHECFTHFVTTLDTIFF